MAKKIESNSDKGLENINNSNLQQDIDNYPGLAINIGDDEKDSEKLRKERTKVLDNNPHGKLL